jgi:probable F420-dependent oxidoreductase
MTATDLVRATRRRLGPVGVWLSPVVVAASPARIQRREVARIERLGYGSIWTGENPGGRDVLVTLGIWLSSTSSITVGSGIANLWARPAGTMRASAEALADAYPDRLVLGVGVGIPLQAEDLGRSYGRPLARTREYLDQMDAGGGYGVGPAATAAGVRLPRVLAAVGPKMLALAGERTDGAHTFGAPVATTASARRILGPDKLLIAEQGIVLDAQTSRARETARAHRRRALDMFTALGLGIDYSPYNRNLLRLGFTEQEIAAIDDGVLDATVAAGDETVILDRIRQHLDAGADHVLINPYAADLPAAVDQLERLAAVSMCR